MEVIYIILSIVGFVLSFMRRDNYQKFVTVFVVSSMIIPIMFNSTPIMNWVLFVISSVLISIYGFTKKGLDKFNRIFFIYLGALFIAIILISPDNYYRLLLLILIYTIPIILFALWVLRKRGLYKNEFGFVILSIGSIIIEIVNKIMFF